MGFNHWNAPDFALRRLRDARRKRRETRAKKVHIELHLKRAVGELVELERSMTGWSAASGEIQTCSILLNDLDPRGVAVFVTRPMVIGSCVSFSMPGTSPFHARGLITSCEMIPTTGKVLSPTGSFRYRVRVSFEFESNDEVFAIHEFARDIHERLLSD